MTTLENVAECVRLVCADLRVIQPYQVTVSQRTSGGRYYSKQKRVHVGLKHSVRMTAENVCLHEIAHHVEQYRHGGRLSEARRSHGPAFVTALHDVVVAWHGRTDRYQWDLDYKCVAREAKKRGYY